MDKVIGVLGGGQLGRMLTEAANRLNIKIVTLDTEASPAKQINANSDHVIGSFTDPAAIRQLAQRCDILTVEIEHVDTDVLEDLENGLETRADWKLVRSTKCEVQPNWRTIRMIQDKYKQKEFLIKNDIPVAKSVPLEDGTAEELERIGEKVGYPLMLKSRTEAYDGRGNFPIKSKDDIEKALESLKDRPLYAEQWENFSMELAVIVVKTDSEPDASKWSTSTMAYPIVETVHQDSICKLVYAPAPICAIDADVAQEAQEMARKAVAGFWGKGVFGVEMFLRKDALSGDLKVNEIAPRPHNSGHYTIEACPLSQYDAQIRAILDLPIPEESLRLNTPDTYSIMLNILGGVETDSHLQVAEKALRVPGARVHLYGKGKAKPGRKMGHITVLASSQKEAEERIEPLIKLVDEIREERFKPARPTGSKTAADGAQTQQKAAELPASVIGPPVVAITMGSDSDRKVLKAGADLLRELQIPFSVTITSAHRTPDRMFKFARDAASKGIKVIIAAAGGAAHLPGMIAALTSLPVIGIPVKASVLDGHDSLLSIVQMPRGCPVATVAINNSNNAAQLAVRILAASDITIRMRLERYLADQTRTVLEKAEVMEKTGIDDYEWNE
ncbi:phosphoribosylaminoimidazole carboxylase ade2 [Agyrium rufum]|nr:phosphoribosylaminoimidazole carboxylase ade2 [Agyrium rufum]